MSNSQTIGLIDMNDIVAYVVDHTRQFFKAKGESAIELEKLLAQWAVPNLIKTQLEQVCNYSGANAFHFLPPTASVWDVVELMNGKHVHRVALLETSGRLAGLITQSTLIRFIHAHRKLSEIQQLLGTKVAALPGATTHMLVSVQESTTAYHAFDVMRKEKVSAVAVCDKSGKLKAVLSNRDLKQIGTSAEAFDGLYKSVVDYLHGEQKFRMFIDLFSSSLVCYSKDEDFGTVLDRVVKFKVHRLYLLDETGRPTGVLSLGDIIRMVRHTALNPRS